jgi:hypothetical protein
MNWQQMIEEVRSRGETLESIAKACGFSSRGHVHGIAMGKRSRVLWEEGEALISLHRRVMRRKVRP